MHRANVIYQGSACSTRPFLPEMTKWNSGAPAGQASPSPGSLPDGSAAPEATRTDESGRPGASRGRKRKLIYILGTGRCGSTAFEIVLGNHPAIRAMGEFYGVAFPRWRPGSVCSCGEPYDRCPFWSEVLARYGTVVDFDRQAAGQARFEAYPSLARTVLHRLFRTAAFREHTRGMAELVRMVSGIAGTEFVSESSKNAVRGYLYSFARSADFDVYYIHLVRDGRGYMYSKTTLPDELGSETRRLVVSPWEITARWVVPNLLANLLCSRPGARYVRVRYEDFVSRPVEVLRRIGEYLELDMSPVVDRVKDRKPIPIVHLIGGNRLRFKPSLTLESRFASVSLGSRESRWAFWTLGGWMAYWFGYLRGAGAATERTNG